MSKKAKAVTTAWAIKDAKGKFVYSARHPAVYLHRRTAQINATPSQSAVRVRVTVEEVAGAKR